MQVRWLRTALQNLDDEATYMAQDDASAACLVVERVLSAVAMLAEQPGPVVPAECLAHAN